MFDPRIVLRSISYRACFTHMAVIENRFTMSAGKKVRGPATPKSVEVKGPVTNPKASSPKAPAMKNSNKGSSSVGVAKSQSESATHAGMSGSPFDIKIKGEKKESTNRNSGSALRGGSDRNSAHSDGNRYGK